MCVNICAACRVSGGTHSKHHSLQENYVQVPSNGVVNSILDRREWSIKWRLCKLYNYTFSVTVNNIFV